MPIPFQAASWAKRSDIPSPTLFGEISGTVQGVYGAGFHAGRKIVQTMGPVAHSFTTLFGAAQASVDEGKTWVDTYRGDLIPDVKQREWVISQFSLDLPNGGIYHYQVRAQLSHSFFVADGSLDVGGVRLYISDNGTSYSMAQQLYAWPNIIADPANTGGNAVLSASPSFTVPILIQGSFYALASYQIDCGGTNNRRTFKAVDLWRSDDGIHWTIVRDLTAVFPFSTTSPSFSSMFLSTTGRVLSLFNGLAAYTATGTPDLVTTSWGLSVGYPNLGGNISPMYGGTMLSHQNGSLISGGSAFVSCDDGQSFTAASGPNIPVGRTAYNLKVGPTEAIIVVPGFVDPTTQTVCYYSSDGGETWQGGDVWIASTIGEKPVAAFLKSDGKPMVISTQRCFVSGDSARGIATFRVICPLANAKLAAARPLALCGLPLTPACKD
jgi:hypothetical protein